MSKREFETNENNLSGSGLSVNDLTRHGLGRLLPLTSYIAESSLPDPIRIDDGAHNEHWGPGSFMESSDYGTHSNPSYSLR